MEKHRKDHSRYSLDKSHHYEHNVSSISGHDKLNFKKRKNYHSSDDEERNEKYCKKRRSSSKYEHTDRKGSASSQSRKPSYGKIPEYSEESSKNTLNLECKNSEKNLAKQISEVTAPEHLTPKSRNTCMEKTVSDKDFTFDWKEYMWELNKLFFSDRDLIKRGSEEYKDFWKFLCKYQGLDKQNKIKKMSDKNTDSEHSIDKSLSCSKEFELPLTYDKRYCINFSLKGKSIKELLDRLPPIDTEDVSVKRLTVERISEFKLILLLFMDCTQKQRFNRLKTIRESQKNLPIADYKDHILETVKNNVVTILAGDTGCGKSTQVPQYLLRAGYTNIACTQPRRIACISLSKRVAYETLNEYGSDVGFQIRFERNKTEHTKIVFVTEGLLLRQIATDPMLLQYNVIILDEIHERHLQTDFLLGVIKCLIVQRPEIKIILMSATINIELFSKYFMGLAPVIQIPGRLYPIELKYFPISLAEKASQSQSINPAPYIRILQLIDNSYSSDERGDLLMFLSGMKEITTVMEAARLYAQQCNSWVILPLHSTLSVSEQEKVFDVPPAGVRKCIISTNIAETSVTIDGVRFVVDSGKVKEMNYDPVHKMQKLKEFWISQASAEQRKGRAGRTGAGVCFRLYSEAEYSDFAAYTSPEILRVPLDSLILQMLAMGIPSIKLFPFIEPPPTESLELSLELLKSHSAVTNDEELTTIGRLLSQLPLDVSLGKMLIMGSIFHQIGPVLSLAAAMSVQSPFTNRAFRDPDCLSLNQGLHSSHGDPFTLLNAFKEWLHTKTDPAEQSRRWCRKRGLEEQRFYEMTKLRQQFTHMQHEGGLRDVIGRNAELYKARSSKERAQRYGELSQLRQMKKDLYNQGPRKVQVLKVDHEGAAVEDDDEQRDVGLELKNLDFKIRFDSATLKQLLRDSETVASSDVILLKLILCSGLYPNIAIPDEHNTYKKGSEQLFHTSAKPFVVLHPNSVFAADPECLQLSNADIANLSGFSERFPCSCRHQALVFVSLLETNKPYLVNSFRLPTVVMFLLFSRNIDTNVDISTIVADEFVEFKFADRIGSQNLLFQAVSLRSKWKSLLETRIKASKPLVENQERLYLKISNLEKELSSGLVDFYRNEQYYSVRRLLAADVKVLHSGPSGHSLIPGMQYPNPFSEEDAPCTENNTKGGIQLTEYLTYNSLIDVQTSTTSITSYDAICPFCDQELHLNTLERLCHLRTCSNTYLDSQEKSADEVNVDCGSNGRADPSKRDFWCDICDKNYMFSIKEILKHKNNHIASD